MRKVLSLFFAFCLMFTCCIAGVAACEHPEGAIQSPSPSITVEDLYDVSGEAMIFRNSKFDHKAMVSAFSENIVDCIPLTLMVDEEDRHVFFVLNYPIQEMYQDCFIIDADCNLIGNVECKYLLCTCGEYWYYVNITLAPGKYQDFQVVYLVWVE